MPDSTTHLQPEVTVCFTSADPLANDSLYQTSLSQGVYLTFPWMWLLEKGAEALATALGTELGKGLGQRLLGGLLGTSDDELAFREEVISRLSRIESKLDEVLSFLNQQLPDLLARIDREGHVIDRNIGLDALLTTVESTVSKAPLRGKLPDKLQDRFLALAERVGEQTESILGYGYHYYQAGVFGLMSLLTLYSRIGRTDKRELSALGGRARHLLAKGFRGLDETNPDSYTSIISRMQTELTNAKSVIAALPHNALTSVTYLPTGNDYSIAWWGMFFLDDSGAQGVWEYRTPKFVKPPVTPPSEYNSSRIASANGLIVIPGTTPPLVDWLNGNPHQSGAFYDQTLNHIRTALSITKSYPQQLEKLIRQRDELESFCNSCRSLSALETEA